MAGGGTGWAQGYFGRNKVVYTDRDWQVFEDGQVHLYFYGGEDELARQALAIATDAYVEFSEYFDFEFTDPIPVILYGTHHDFKQTHVTPGFISEGTAGFTEFAKGRVAIRATGSYADLYHLVRHELVHAFMLSKLAKTMNEHGIYDYTGPPLWFIEGLAENVARRDPDAQAEMFVRDAALNERLLPISQMWRISGTFLMYKMGESIIAFLRTQYGEKVPALLLESWWRGRGLEDILRAELGIGLEELSQRWLAYLKRRYFPEMLTRRLPAEDGQPVLQKAVIEIAPAFVAADAEGTLDLACLSARGGLLSLYHLRTHPDQPDEVRRLVEGGRKARYETIPAFRSRIDVRDGRWIAFVAKSGGQDALYVYDLQRSKVVRAFRFDEIREVSSPAFSPDGRSIAFSGLSPAGFSDLYRVDVEDGRLTQLTDDIYDDVHPDWHPTEPRLIFASDRHGYSHDRGYLEGVHNLYTMDLDRGEIEPFALSEFEDTEPMWSPDGEDVLYVSTRSGTLNVHVIRDGSHYQVTNVTGGAYLPDWIEGPNGDLVGVVATVYHDGGFSLYRFSLDGLETRYPVVHGERPQDVEPPPEPPLSEAEAVAREYDIDMGLDFVQTVAVVDPDLPYASGASLGFTDLLGDHQVSVSLTTSGEDLSLENINVSLNYSNYARRWNRHFGIFRISTLQRLSTLVNTRQERRTGSYVGVTYPFSVFDRLEFSTVFRYLERAESFQLPGEPGQSWLLSAFASFVHDNSLWAWQGPLRGNRYQFTVGQTWDLLGRGFDRQTIQFDYRHYYQVWRTAALAVRWNQRHSFGSDSAIFYVGGPNDLRGYDWYDFFGERVYLASTEFRFPLIDHIALRFPFFRFDIPNIRGALFFDAADIQGPVFDTDWIGSFGYGIFLPLLPPLVLRMDVARPHDFENLQPWRVDFHLSFLY